MRDHLRFFNHERFPVHLCPSGGINYFDGHDHNATGDIDDGGNHDFDVSGGIHHNDTSVITGSVNRVPGSG